jgi:hypothetical protein
MQHTTHWYCIIVCIIRNCMYIYHAWRVRLFFLISMLTTVKIRKQRIMGLNTSELLHKKTSKFASKSYYSRLKKIGFQCSLRSRISFIIHEMRPTIRLRYFSVMLADLCNFFKLHYSLTVHKLVIVVSLPRKA